MPTKSIDRLMFAQGGLCFFCKKILPKADASVEHLVASANNGSNSDDNCVACCKSVNALLGSMSLKEKIQVVLNQKGQFKCPNASTTTVVIAATAVSAAKIAAKKTISVISFTPEHVAQAIANLEQRGESRPRTVKTLTSTVSSIFNKQFPEPEIQSLIKHLQARGVVKFSGTKVSYSFPAVGA